MPAPTRIWSPSTLRLERLTFTVLWLLIASPASPGCSSDEGLGPALRSWQPMARHQAPVLEHYSSTGADTVDTMPCCWLARMCGQHAAAVAALRTQ